MANDTIILINQDASVRIQDEGKVTRKEQSTGILYRKGW